MIMKNLDPKELSRFAKKWIAIDARSGEIVKADSSLIKLENKIVKLGKKEIQIVYIPSTDSFLSP